MKTSQRAVDILSTSRQNVRMQKNLSTPRSPAAGAAAPSQVVGFRLSQITAREVKLEAAKRGIKLNQLFEELWAQYKDATRTETKA